MEKIGRSATLPTITFKILHDLNLQQVLQRVNQPKLFTFLGKIYRGYRRSVEYHNDLHGCDVLQMIYIFIK